MSSRYTRLQTVWSLPGHSRQANKDHNTRCHRRPNGPGRLADKVVQPTIQSAEGCTLTINICARFFVKGIASYFKESSSLVI